MGEREPASRDAPAPLHLLKLCVGADSIAALEEWIAHILPLRGEQFHTTRSLPKRAAEILTGGSLYWVIRHQIAARQRVHAIRPFTDGDGIGRCHLILEPAVIPVVPRPCRPFQGWRYLTHADAPPDLREAGAGGEMPEALRRELAGLGLL